MCLGEIERERESVCVCLCVCVCVCVCGFVRVYESVCVHMYKGVCVCVRTCVMVCICVLVSVHMHAWCIGHANTQPLPPGCTAIPTAYKPPAKSRLAAPAARQHSGT